MHEHYIQSRMATLYVTMYVEEGRRTSILGVFSTKENAKRAITPSVREMFGAQTSRIRERDNDDYWSYFLIRPFITDREDQGLYYPKD